MSESDKFQPMTPIVTAAVRALVEFEERVLLEMGYDLEYAQEDLPKIVERAIAPWAVPIGEIHLKNGDEIVGKITNVTCGKEFRVASEGWFHCSLPVGHHGTCGTSNGPWTNAEPNGDRMDT